MSRGAKPTKAKRAKAKVAADRAGRRKPLKKEASGRHSLEQRLAEALEQQTATAEILRVISSSPTEVQPVFDVIARRARSLCEADSAGVFTYDGEMLHLESLDNVGFHGADALRTAYPMPANPAHASGRVILEGHPVHIPDVQADRNYDLRAVLDAGLRSVLAVPMLRGGTAIGTIVLHAWAIPRPFSDKQIALLQTFADQAVIAIENVRMFKELQARNRDLTETLEQQTATGEILRAISSSPTDAQPVFDVIAESARRLCEGQFCQVFRLDAGSLHFVAYHGHSREGVEATRRAFPAPSDRGTAAGRAILSAAVVQIPDVEADPEYALGAVARAVRFRSLVAVPMMREGVPIGAIAVARSGPGPFPDRQIDLLKTFADQAVIAIQNVRLFTQVQEQNRELIDALERQTAMGDILRVISSSPTDVQPMLDTVAESAARLCESFDAAIWRRDDDRLLLVAHHGPIPVGRIGEFSLPLIRGTVAGRSVVDARTVHVADVQSEVGEFPESSENARRMGFRTILSAPLMREGVAIGSIQIRRTDAQLFAGRQVVLLETFADQAVIAIENVRLFKELEARNRELTETLEQQTATSEILRVISSSPTDVQPVLDAVTESAARLCESLDSAIWRRDGDRCLLVAHNGGIPIGPIGEFSLPLVRGTIPGRSVLDGQTIHVADAPTEVDEFPESSEHARRMGFRTILNVPLMREGVAIGMISLRRTEVHLFTERQVALLETFADQAVIAIENVRLFQELQTRTRDLMQSVGELRALGEVSQAVGSTLDLETVLATIVSRAVQLSGSDQGLVYEFDEATQTFQQRATHQITPEYVEALREAPIRLGEGAMGRAGVIWEPVQVADIHADWQLVAPQVRAFLDREGVRSLLAIPLIREERLLGGLVILRTEPGAFSPAVVATLQTFAAQSVLAIHNARLFREIQRQKQYSDALVETSPVAIATMDLRGMVVGWNPGAERLFGYSPGEALGREVDELVATPEIREEVRENLRLMHSGQRVRAITRRARKDGTLVDVEVSSMPVVVDGAEVGSIAIYHDITELLQARREAEAANEAKSAFLATMSHEIRTPMNAVIGMSGLLLNTALTDEQREFAEIVRQSGDTLLTVINDILDFSKIEAGRLDLESQPFDLRECVEGALDLVATRAAEKGLDLAYVLGDGTPAAIVGDVTRLRQVLLNLLSNAVKFTEAGEVVLSVSAHAIQGLAALHELTFSVRDTGIGIPEDRLVRLFQSFTQVDASTTRRYGGTGLGLAISQRLTELMGGRIVVTSEVGIGSDFRFTIRAVAAESPGPSRRDLSGVQPSLRGKRVLVVDDNATNRRILTLHLEAWGMLSRATGSPAEALAWIRADERFDVAILDMHMPEMDGVALAHAIRERPAGAALPLVLFTSLGRREARAEEEGFAAYLHKPIKPSQLFDALATVLADRPGHVPKPGAARTELDPDMARRHPLRILLAEDNVVNQKLAVRLLAQMGYRADLAANGLEAIDAVERQTYDVVLMDVQMPEMDGFEASREINRRWPDVPRPRLVAMTANAMEGDRELCTAAGMDDYVAKPIRVEELVAALERCRWHPDADDRGAPAVAAIDRKVVERLAATMGGPFVAELIDTFAEDARELIATLRWALAENDVDAFRRAAHSLKSNGESLGATELAALARELEAMARGGSLQGAADRIEPLVAGYEAAARALGELRRELLS